MGDITPVFLSEFIFPSSIMTCPYDAASLDTLARDVDNENVAITYHCGTTRNVGVDGLLRIAQATSCALNQLHILRDLDEPGLRQELEESNQARGLLAEQLDEANIQVSQLEAEIAILKGGIASSQAVRFRLEFGTPVAKGTP